MSMVHGVCRALQAGALLLCGCGEPGAADKQVDISPLPEQETMSDKQVGGKVMVQKHVLHNGMTVLVRPDHTVPQVTVQLWYGVGSKYEKDKERGFAHLIEHMIFKGSEMLSESDINVVTHTLSGNCNAFTSYDYTGYLFNFPKWHWQEALPIMADCMRNASFDDQALNSEIKAVVQEIKMYRDMYARSLMDEMVSSIFPDHPYHHPIIGYKQDLWKANGAALRKFYEKHYAPNNATLVVVGDVEPQEVFDAAEKYFGHLKSDAPHEREKFYFNRDMVSKDVMLYRDVQQPTLVYAFVVPGSHEKQDQYLNILEWAIGHGKASRLHKKLVNELELATSVRAMTESLFDHGIFFVVAEPKSADDAEQIGQIIQAELDDIAAGGMSDAELERAVKQTRKQLHDLLEDNEEQANEIGRYFLATGDPNYVFNFLVESDEELRAGVERLAADYFRPSVTHHGAILPLAESDRDLWMRVQQESDEEDLRILSARERTKPVEPPVYATKIKVREPGVFDFPKAKTATLANGMKVFTHETARTPKIDIVLDLRAKHYYDPQDKQGMLLFVSKMLTEGTKNYPGEALAEAIEAHGMSLASYAGGIVVSLLKEDLPFALEILREIVTNAEFGQREIEKVRGQILAGLKKFWDQPLEFSKQLVREEIYRNHPYSKNPIGSTDVIEAMTRDDLLEYYGNFVTSDGARIAIVGDIEGYDVQAMLEGTLGSWQGKPLAVMEFPPLDPIKPQLLDYQIDRDQVVLSFAGLSIDRKSPDYDKLLLFDQIFGGGALRSMSSRLFLLREETGLFYAIAGSLIAGSSEQPGMNLVRTIVSLDRLVESEQRIRGVINEGVGTISPEEMRESRDAVTSATISSFASNAAMAESFLFLDKYNFPADYFDTRAVTLAAITIDEVKEAVGKIMNTDEMIELRVGRTNEIAQQGTPIESINESASE